MPVLVAELEAVVSFEPAQRIQQLPHLRDLKLWPPWRRSEPLQSADVDRRDSGVIGTVRNAGQAVATCLRRSQREPSGIAVGVVPAEARAQLVEHGRLQEVRPC